MKSGDFGIIVHSVVALAVLALAAFGEVRPAYAATVIYVKADATGANNGSSWSDAYTRLQSALLKAVSGQQIWVAKGTYKPTTTTDRTKTFVLKDGVGVFGGFLGNEAFLKERNPNANVTTLSGDIGTGGNFLDDSYHVVTASNISSSAILDGFTILGGRADAAYPNSSGGGMLVNMASPTLSHLDLTTNHASAGGGMYIVSSSSRPKLANVIFRNNFADSGAAVYASVSSKPTFTNVIITGNTASIGGGAMDIQGLSEVTVIGAYVGGNTAKYGGGVSVVNGASAIFNNVTFFSNSASSHGGAAHVSGGSVSILNATFALNSDPGSGGAIFTRFDSKPHISDSIFSDFEGREIDNSDSVSTPTLIDSIVQGGCPAGASCINVLNADPKLQPLAFNGGLTRTMALGAGSAAIDAGGTHSTCAAADQRGVTRPQGAACDMGAYEVRVLKFGSVGADDGQVLESSETSGLGGSKDSTSASFRVGDDASNRQYRGVLSFDTSGLPDASTVVLTKLRMLKQGLVGTNPFTTHGNLLMKLNKPFFGGNLALQLGDFQAGATVGSAGTIGATPISGWYTGLLSAAALSGVNTAGTTQLRLQFALDDNNDHGADYLSFYSGDAGTTSSRPRLIVYYNP